MAEIKLYIATTIDGYIAREDGSLDWLYALPNPNQIDHGYSGFFETIDTVIMGRTTYETILGFGVEWPYSNCISYVITSKENYQAKTPNTKVLNNLSIENLDKIKADSKKHIWLIGGGKVITEFINFDQIDEMILCMIPTILGTGIRLFPDKPKETLFQLTKSESFKTGIINLTYRKK